MNNYQKQFSQVLTNALSQQIQSGQFDNAPFEELKLALKKEYDRLIVIDQPTEDIENIIEEIDCILYEVPQA